MFVQEVAKVKKSKTVTSDGSVKKKDKSKSGKYSKVPPPKEQVVMEEQVPEDEPMEGMLLLYPHMCIHLLQQSKVVLIPCIHYGIKLGRTCSSICILFLMDQLI